MRRILSSRRLSRLAKDEDGSSTIEFVIMFPLLIAMVLSFFEAGWLMSRGMMLERGVDLAARDIRLGYDADITHDELREDICEYAKILVDCERDLIVEVVEMDLAQSYPQNQPNCIDRTGDIEPVIDFSPAGRNRIMFLRACVVIDPIFPGIGLGLHLPKDSSGGFQLVSYTAFMNEPA